MKKKADARKNVKESVISEGDLILIRQMQRNKTVSPFDPRPYLVIQRNGSQIVAQREEKVVLITTKDSMANPCLG